MLTQTQSIENFKTNMDELLSCKYVLSAKKISNLLKGVSSSKLFIELFDFCTQGFNYQDSFKKYFTTTTSAGRRFLLPPDSKTIIALGVCVLYAIDARELDFVTLLNEYFYENDVNAAYARFAKELLYPFKREVLIAVNAMVTGALEAPDARQTVKETAKVLSDSDVKTIKELLEQSKSVILQYKLEPDLKAELMCLYDNFIASLYEGEGARIKVAYLGYKYGILYHKRHDVGLMKIQEILSKGGIL